MSQISLGSLLAYELPDGRLKLIDGHLRRDIDPDMEVDVEVLDVSDEEARALLLSIEPLASLAETQAQLHRRLLELAPPVPDDLQAAWEATAQGELDQLLDRSSDYSSNLLSQFLVLVTCRDEALQAQMIARLQAERVECKALLS